MSDALTRRVLEEHLTADELGDPGQEVDRSIFGSPVESDRCFIPWGMDGTRATWPA